MFKYYQIPSFLAFDFSVERLAKAIEVGATEVLNTKKNEAVAFIKERHTHTCSY